MKTSIKRVNGFSLPLTSHQVFACAVYLFASILTLLLVTSIYVEAHLKLPLLIVEVVFLALTVMSWLLTSIIDPAGSSSSRISTPASTPPDQQKEGVGEQSSSRHLLCVGVCKVCDDILDLKRATRYCAQCGKSVVGMDHHCTWLNNCIGNRNYAPFLCLTFISLGQMAYQVVVAIISLVSWSHYVVDNENQALPMGDHVIEGMWRFRLLASLCAVISGTTFIFLSTLAAFHF